MQQERGRSLRDRGDNTVVFYGRMLETSFATWVARFRTQQSARKIFRKIDYGALAGFTKFLAGRFIIVHEDDRGAMPHTTARGGKNGLIALTASTTSRVYGDS